MVDRKLELVMKFGSVKFVVSLFQSIFVPAFSKKNNIVVGARIDFLY